MKKSLSYIKKYISIAIYVIVIGTIELFILRKNISLLIFTQWQEIGSPQSEAEFVIEYGYVKSKNGIIYKNYSLIDPNGSWINEWLEVEEIEEEYSYDSNISNCEIPNIVNVKSIIIRCRKLENYSKTYAMAIGKDGRIYDYINSSARDIISFVYSLLLIIAINLNFGLLIVIIGYLVERNIEQRK
jgi:hypothetical protein